MRDESKPCTTIGRAFTLLIAPTGAQAALGPAWSVLCGAIASGNWRWERDRLLNLLAVLFVAEILWSTWRAVLVDMDWPTYIDAHPLPERGDAMLLPPYTTPWSPLGRLFDGWGKLRHWIDKTLPIERRSALLTLPILPPLIIVLSAMIGTQVLALSMMVLALTSIEWRLACRGKTHHSLQASSEIAASWLAGHLVFGPLTWQSFILACCYALVYQGALYLRDERLSPGARSWALALMYGGQSAALGFLITLGHPLAAMTLGLLGTPQLLLLTRLDSNGKNVRYLRQAAPFLMISMLIAAWMI